MATLIFASFLIGVIIATPLWVKYSQKTKNNKKTMLISAIGLGITTLPLLFFTNYWAVVAVMLIWGLFLGGFWVMIFPVMADVIDESVVITGKREEGVYSGFSQFFARIGIVAQTVTFAIVHSLTGFVEGAETQIPEAAFGIQIHLGLIPAIFIFIGAFFFWRYYKLTPDKIEGIQVKLGDLGLK
jgi:Na+/melibiose symporter-like transporter